MTLLIILAIFVNIVFISAIFAVGAWILDRVNNDFINIFAVLMMAFSILLFAYATINLFV